MKKVYSMLVLLFVIFNARAQQNVSDSVRRLITATKDDTTRILLINRLSQVYYASNPDTAIRLAQHALWLSSKINFLNGEARSLYSEGNVFMVTGAYPKALTCYLSALKINEKLNKPRSVSENLAAIAIVYYYERDYRKCIDFTLKSKTIAESLGDENTLGFDLLNLGGCYETLNILDTARIYTIQSYKLALKLKNLDVIGNANNNLGNIYSKMNEPEIALNYYRSAIPYLKQEDDDDVQCETTLGMAKLFKQLGQQDSSLHYARMSIISGTHGGFTSRVLDASNFLTNYFKVKGNLDSAFRYQELSISARDSLFSQEKTREVQNLSIAEQQRQQEIEQQKLAEEETNKKNLQLAGIAIFIPTFCLFIIFLSRRKTKPHTVEFMGIVALLLVFEFITLVAHPYIEHWTHDTPVLTLIILVAIAAVLVPMHHRTEHWVKSKLVHKVTNRADGKT